MRTYNVADVQERISRVELLWELNGEAHGGYQQEYDKACRSLVALVGKETADAVLPEYILHPFW